MKKVHAEVKMYALRKSEL